MNLLLHPLVWPIAFPLAAGLVCFLMPRFLARVLPAFAVAAGAVTVLLAWPTFAAVLKRPLGKSLSPLDSALPYLTADHLSSFILLAITIFGALITLYSIQYMNGKARLCEYYAYLLWTVGLSCGVVLTNDLLLLLILWGLLGVTLYVLIGIAGPDASAAAKKSLVIVGGSDCFLMLGIAILWVLTGTTRMPATPLPLLGTSVYVAFFCFAVAAFAKAGAMPFHSWIPDCGEKAPASVTAFLPASLDKLLGIYLLTRTAMNWFQMNAAVNTFLMIIGAGTVLCAVMMALVQHDLKRLLSYHAVSQVGYMLLGIGTGTLVGLAGGLFHMLNNAIYKSSLFLCAGAVEKKTGTTDLDKLGGLAATMPATFATCLVAALAISGIPPLNGFFSKWMIYQGIVESGRNGGHLWVLYLVAALLGSALTLASFVKVLHAVFLCKSAKPATSHPVTEVGFSMGFPMLSLAALCIVFGVLAYRLPLMTMIFPATGHSVVAFSGLWSAAPATLMMVAGYALGMAIYYFTTVRKARTCPTYVGGEILDEVSLHGDTSAQAEDVRVTGVDFYRTVEDLPFIRSVFRAAHDKFFDLYEVGAGVVFYIFGMLRHIHSGLLPTYVAWFLIGFLLVLWILVRGAVTI